MLGDNQQPQLSQRAELALSRREFLLTLPVLIALLNALMNGNSVARAHQLIERLRQTDMAIILHNYFNLEDGELEYLLRYLQPRQIDGVPVLKHVFVADKIDEKLLTMLNELLSDVLKDALTDEDPPIMRKVYPEYPHFHNLAIASHSIPRDLHQATEFLNRAGQNYMRCSIPVTINGIDIQGLTNQVRGLARFAEVNLTGIAVIKEIDYRDASVTLEFIPCGLMVQLDPDIPNLGGNPQDPGMYYHLPLPRNLLQELTFHIHYPNGTPLITDLDGLGTPGANAGGMFSHLTGFTNPETMDPAAGTIDSPFVTAINLEETYNIGSPNDEGEHFQCITSRGNVVRFKLEARQDGWLITMLDENLSPLRYNSGETKSRSIDVSNVAKSLAEIATDQNFALLNLGLRYASSPREGYTISFND